MEQDSSPQIDWNEYAINYDSLLRLRPYTDMLEEVAEIIRREWVGSVLDAGCGTGNLLSKLIASSIPNITGMDSSVEMLARAEAKCAKVRFVHGELNASLPFSDKTFEAIACVNALYAVENPRHTLAEFARIIVPNGLLVVVTPKQGYENGLILKAHCASTEPDEYWKGMHSDPVREEKLMREALQNEETFRQMRTVADVNRRISQNAQFHFFNEHELRTIVGEAGFSIVDVRETYAEQSHLLFAYRT